MEDNKQFGGLDYFKVIAALLVVAIHTAPFSMVNDTLDFLFTGILARVAVPFFLMTTGFFLLPQYLFEKSSDYHSLWQFIKRTLLLYGIAIIIYLPVNIYAGQLRGISFFIFLRMLIFDGTFYHLWYLPASILGVLLLVFASRKLSFQVVFVFSLIFYGFGLLGDSYYGFIASDSILDMTYQAMFKVFSYTRNGFFYTPVFLAMGAGIKQRYNFRYSAFTVCGFVFSVSLMIFEGLILNHLGVQRHNSMYVTLLPTMFFLFQMILQVNVYSVRALRIISTWIYMIHPLFIVLVRGIAKITHTERLLIEDSIIHYFAVCSLSVSFAVIMQKILLNEKLFHTHSCLFGTDRTATKKSRAWIELDRNNLRKNIYALESLLPQGCELMPAVKANAYGHGAVIISKELNRMGIKSFCVATVSEGIELRRGGIKGEILILGYTHPKQFPMLQKYHLTQSVIDFSYAQLLNSFGRKIKVHLKIDTGMHRLGIRAENKEEILQIYDLKNLSIEGIYTHLCNADDFSLKGKEFTHLQGKFFFEVIQQLEKCRNIHPKIHIQSSYGLLNYPELSGNYARVGIALYGVLSQREDLDYISVNLYPVLSVKARVTTVKEVFAGETVGYGCHYKVEQNGKIAVLAIGYADGIPRNYAENAGCVLINGVMASIVGRMCMDQMIIDVTNISNVRQGDIAVIIGKSGENEMTVYDIAERSGTITNEILSRLGERLDRVMI